MDTGLTRTEKIRINNWNFNEWPKLTSTSKTIEACEKYLGFGGFPEFANKKESLSRIRKLTLGSMINDDIPSSTRFLSINLSRFLIYLARRKNGELNISKTSKDLGMNMNQVYSHLDIFERTQLIISVKQINENFKFPKYEKNKYYVNPHYLVMSLNKPFRNRSKLQRFNN